jgi:hypothetical protein
MGIWKKFVTRRPRVSKQYRAYNLSVKNAKGLEIIINKNTRLRKLVSVLFSSKTLALAATSTVIGVGISKINDYIQSNSGCFLISNDTVCKVRALSCCQPEPVNNIAFCPEIPLGYDPCHGYDEDKEKECCKLCSCQESDCLPHQTMECRRPTIAEALSYYAQGLSSDISKIFTSLILPVAYWFLSGFVILLVLFFLYKRIRGR